MNKAQHFERFVSKIRVRRNGCWQWMGSFRSGGYGVAWSRREYRAVGAHRLAYEHFIGEIPNRLEIDHLCRNRWCVNPTHLEIVTRGENTKRANDARTHCKHGHRFTPNNTAVYKGMRYCLKCKRDSAMNYYWRTIGRPERGTVTPRLRR